MKKNIIKIISRIIQDNFLHQITKKAEAMTMKKNLGKEFF
jgi:hypothetical protein